jgi:hypothetical protein
MAAVLLSEAPIAALKKALRAEFSDVKSSHLSEALAWSAGFRTHASLLAAMQGPEDDRPFVLLDTARMLARLEQLGYPKDPEFDFELTIDAARPLGAVSTMPDSAYEIVYTTARQRAWRNLMVCAVNAGLEQRLFTLRPGDNRFVDTDRSGVPFDFVLPNGLPARGWVADAGFQELSVHAAVHPKATAANSRYAGFAAGDAFGTTWLERERGAWIQFSDGGFKCRRALLETLAQMKVEPAGYGDRGAIIL